MKGVKRCGVRRRLVSGWLSGVFAVLVMTGCRDVDCDDRRCKIVEVALAEIYVAEVMCCRNEEMGACATLHDRSGALLRLIDLAYEACLDRDWIRLGEIWKQIRALKIIRNHVIPIIGEICGGVELLMGLNSMPVFSDQDAVTFDCAFERVAPPRPISSGISRPELPVADAPMTTRFQSTYEVSPGSNLSAETWFGESQLMLQGRVSLEHVHPAGPGHGSSDDSGCRIDRIAELRLDLLGDGLSGRIRFHTDENAGHHVLDEEGHGMLVGVARVSMEFDQLPALRFEEIFGETFWIEIPIRLDDGLLMISPQEVVGGLDLLPVSSEVGMLFDQARQLLSGHRPFTQDDPCQESAMAYVEDLKQIFSSCYPGFSEMDH